MDSVSIETLHQRLGQLAWSTLRHVTKDSTSVAPRELSTCEGCQLGKQTRRSYTPSTHRATKPFELIHVNLAGPMQTRSMQGNLYCMTIVDDYTSAYFTYYINKKSQALGKFILFNAHVKTALGYTLRNVRSDPRGEFTGTEFNNYLTETGIGCQLTAPDTPQQNGQAERANRTLIESARAMMHHAGMSNGFWEYSIAAAVYI